MAPPAKRREVFVERRKHLGFTQESLAFALDVSVSSVAQWERGIMHPSPRHRRRLAELLEIGLQDLDRALDPDAEPSEIDGHLVPPWFDLFASLEQAAGAVWSVDFVAVPGLLQTSDYAEAVMRSYNVALTEQQVVSRVENRLTRGGALTRDADPLQLSALLDQSVLDRTMGSPAVMLAQLDALLQAIERPNIDLRLLPMDGRAHAASFGFFSLMVRPGAPGPFLLCTEHWSSVRYEEVPSVVEDHAALFGYLEGISLSEVATIHRIQRAREQYR